jgi:hypothetical protein
MRVREAVRDPFLRVRAELAVRFHPVEWILLAGLIILPTAFMWQFASPSYFFWDDLGHLYLAHTRDSVWSYAFEPSWGYLAPMYNLTYLATQEIAPLNFDLALAFLLACQAVSAVLLQRVLTLLFGRTWWTYALAFTWAISVAYLPSFMWFAGGVNRIPAITATLASIHGYLCWRATGRRLWIAWSVGAVLLGLGFYLKALLIPLYLVLMRILLLDPTARLRDSLRSLRAEWWVWLAYGAVCVAFLAVYTLGDYLRPQTGVTVIDVLHYLSVFWVEGFSPVVFGVRIPLHGQENWYVIAIVAAQVTLIGLIGWSLVRRRRAWRAWTFLLIATLANALILLGRLSQFGAEFVGYYIYYYTEPALLVALAIAFAFATPRLAARVAVVTPTGAHQGSADRSGGQIGTAGNSFPGPSTGVAILTGALLAAYVGLTWSSADAISDPAQEVTGLNLVRAADARVDGCVGRRCGVRSRGRR